MKCSRTCNCKLIIRKINKNKQCSKLGEEGKTGVRNVRRDKVAAIKKLEKDKSIGKDEALDGTDLIDAATKKSIKQIDDIVKAKEEEVSKV